VFARLPERGAVDNLDAMAFASARMVARGRPFIVALDLGVAMLSDSKT
jgi:hypothetical protein